jgi:hypothetical protein
MSPVNKPGTSMTGKSQGKTAISCTAREGFPSILRVPKVGISIFMASIALKHISIGTASR